MTSLWSGLLCLLVLGAAQPTASASSIAAAETLWRDEARTEPSFIPAAALAGDPDSGVPDSLLDKARTSIRQIAAEKGRRPPCLPAVKWGVPGESGGWLSLEDKLRAGHPAFLGKVTRLVPGWSPEFGYVVSRVHVEVEETLSDPRHQLRPGSSLSYLQEAGTLELEGIVLCTTHAPYRIVRPGDRVVVVALFDPVNEGHLATGAQGIYPVENGFVLTPPPVPAEAKSKIPLKSVRAAARRLVQ